VGKVYLDQSTPEPGGGGPVDQKKPMGAGLDGPAKCAPGLTMTCLDGMIHNGIAHHRDAPDCP
jgi:hypothetical protein